MKRLVSIPASLSELLNLRESLLDFIGTDLDEIDRSRVILAIDEAVANVIIHGYKNDASQTVDIKMESDSRSLTFTITDKAYKYNPLEYAFPEMEVYHENGRCGGLGVDLYSRIMKVNYESNPAGGNRLILVKEK